MLKLEERSHDSALNEKIASCNCSNCRHVEEEGCRAEGAQRGEGKGGIDSHKFSTFSNSFSTEKAKKLAFFDTKF